MQAFLAQVTAANITTPTPATATTTTPSATATAAEQAGEQECTFPFEACSARHKDERDRLAQRLDRKTGKWTANHPRWRLLKAIDGFRGYTRLNREDVKKWREVYGHLPQGQRDVSLSVLCFLISLTSGGGVRGKG